MCVVEAQLQYASIIITDNNDNNIIIIIMQLIRQPESQSIALIVRLSSIYGETN